MEVWVCSLLAAPATSIDCAKRPDFQLQMHDGRFAGSDRDRLVQSLEALGRHSYRIASFRDVSQMKLAVRIGYHRLAENRDLRTRNRPVLRIMHNALQNGRGRAHGQAH